MDEMIARDIAAFEQGEGFDLGVVPLGDQVDASYCLRYLRAMRDVAFATTDEDGLPSVRIIDVMAVTSDRLYFLAPRGKAFHEDVVRQGYVAIVGMTPDLRTCRLRGTVMRPSGEREQRALVDAIFDLNPSMNEIYPDDRRYICDVFYVESGQGEYFDLGQKPIFRRSFALGAATTKAGTFVISDACTGCGECASACPEGCIAPGLPYEIDQEHCLRCGICQETCRFGAVLKR